MPKSPLFLVAAVLFAACDYYHLGVAKMPRDELPPVLDFGPIDDQAGHAIALPHDAIPNDLRLLAATGAPVPPSVSAFTDYFDGVLPLDPAFAPPWLTASTLESQAAAARALVAAYGTGAPIDPLDDVTSDALPAHARPRLGDCGGAAARCLELALDTPLPDPPEARWARVRFTDGKTGYGHVRRYVRDRDGRIIAVVLDDPPASSVLASISSDTPVAVGLAGRARVARPALAFVHVSDVQIREGAVKLGSERFSRIFDHVVQSLERNPDQERYEVYLWGALVATINAETRQATRLAKYGYDTRIAPEFVIHTGDTSDCGLEAEFRRFHELADRLTIPWLNVVGNHDILAFGNFPPGRCLSVKQLLAAVGAQSAPSPVDFICVDKDITCEGAPTCGTQRFIGDAPDPIAHFVALHKHDAPVPTLPYAATANHGFDLGDNKGHYAFARPLDLGDGVERRAIFIVLQTNSAAGGASGTVDDGEIAWLKQRLAKLPGGEEVRPQDLIFVFGHDPLNTVPKAFGGKALVDAVESSPNVVGFIAGHTHRHGIRPHPVGKTGRGFWEIETGSIISFPQEARLITLKTVGGGLAFFETLTFAQAFKGESAYREKLRLATDGAIADACNDGFPCRKGRVLPVDPSLTNRRLFFRLPSAN